MNFGLPAGNGERTGVSQGFPDLRDAVCNCGECQRCKDELYALGSFDDSFDLDDDWDCCDCDCQPPLWQIALMEASEQHEEAQERRDESKLRKLRQMLRREQRRNRQK